MSTPSLLLALLVLPAPAAQAQPGLAARQAAFTERASSLKGELETFLSQLRACEIPIRALRERAEGGFQSAVEGVVIHEQSVVEAAGIAGAALAAGPGCEQGLTDARERLQAAKTLYDTNTAGSVDDSLKARTERELLSKALAIRKGKNWLDSSPEEQLKACADASAAIDPLRARNAAMVQAFNELSASVASVSCGKQAGSSFERRPAIAPAAGQVESAAERLPPQDHPHPGEVEGGAVSAQ